MSGSTRSRAIGLWTADLDSLTEALVGQGVASATEKEHNLYGKIVGRVEKDAEAARRLQFVAQVRWQVTEKRQRRPGIVRPVVILNGHHFRMLTQDPSNGSNFPRRHGPYVRPEPGLLLMLTACSFQPVEIRVKRLLSFGDVPRGVARSSVARSWACSLGR